MSPTWRSKPVHFYHLFCGSAFWRHIAEEHFTALKTSGFIGDVRVGLVGAWYERQEAVHRLSEWWPSAKVVATADWGYEQVTIRAMHEFACTAHFRTPILYAHTKGSWRTGGSEHVIRNQIHWRWCMTECTVTHWEDCVNLLETYDAAGAHWITREIVHSLGEDVEGDGPYSGYFGGNFWWATAGYLAGLPAVGNEDRMCAEAWIGLDYPKVANLAPGWILHVEDLAYPGVSVCAGYRLPLH